MAKFYQMPNGKIAGHDGKPVILTQQQFEDCCCEECVDAICITQFNYYGGFSEGCGQFESRLIEEVRLCKVSDIRWEGRGPIDTRARQQLGPTDPCEFTPWFEAETTWVIEFTGSEYELSTEDGEYFFGVVGASKTGQYELSYDTGDIFEEATATVTSC